MRAGVVWTTMLAPLLVAGYKEPNAEWIPGMSAPTVPPLPPRDPDAEVVRPIVDPRPIIDGNFPVATDHRFAGFFENDKPRLPENYDRELAAQGLSPEQRRYGEHFGDVQTAERHGRYPIRLRNPHQPRGSQQQQQPSAARVYTESAPPRPGHRARPSAEVPPARPPLPDSYRPSVQGRTGPNRPASVQSRPDATEGNPILGGSRTVPLENGYLLQLVPSGDVDGQHETAPVPHRRRVNNIRHRVPTRAEFWDRASGAHGPAHQKYARQQRRSDDYAFSTENDNQVDVGNDLHEPLPEFPDLSDPADIERHHQEMRERMDRIHNRAMASLGPNTYPETPSATVTHRRLPASANADGVLVEHHEKRSNEPYVRESYKVFKLPNGHKTSYSRHTSTSYTTTRRGRRHSRRPALRRVRRDWYDHLASSISDGVSEAGDALSAAGDALSGAAAHAGDAVASVASSAYQRGRQAAAQAGDALAQVPDLASRAGSAIYNSASDAYRAAAASDAGRAVSAHVDRLAAEVDTASVVESVQQAGTAISQTAGELASGVSRSVTQLTAGVGRTASEAAEEASDTASAAGDFLEKTGRPLSETAVDAMDVIAKAVPIA